MSTPLSRPSVPTRLSSANRPSLASRPSLYSRSSLYNSSIPSSDSSVQSQSPSTDASSVSDTTSDLEDVPLKYVPSAAIVGMACRLPGAKNPTQLWNNIVEQRDLQRKMPKDRFNVDAFYHPDGTNKGTTNAKYGYFLDDDISEFDPEFFQISGKEAEAMDPQQRLLLEVVYEALENSGITLDQISGSQTSVFCGCFTNDYREMATRDSEFYPKYTVTGTGAAILSNRISYFYNLHGPSVTIDTACSSSLVGFHMGAQSIRDGESDISIIVGSALHFDPTIFITMTDLGFLSSDGRCRAFDANGAGYVRGEGICAVVLKRKTLAEIEGNTIRAIVRGTGSNHDGQKEGITMPNSVAQEALIRSVYKKTGLSTHDTTYFEAHGTGTQAGDPRETRAIGAVFAPNRKQPLIVGSIKTNVGHLEGASGLAAIIKTTMSLEAGKILPNMHFQNPNPNIDFKNWKITVPTKLMDWEPSNGIRRASINSFGYGGANAHVILQNAQQVIGREITKIPQQSHADMVVGRSFLLPLTSHTEKAGKLLKESVASFIEGLTDFSTADIAASLGDKGRSLHQYRTYVIGNDKETVLKGLKGPGSAWTRSTQTKPRVGFVFTGQGAQWFAMGRQLMEQSPFFRQTIERCDEVLQQLPHKPDWTCLEELQKTKQDSRVNETAFSSPLCAAIQIAVVDLFREWGIEPSATVGHSAGEIPAAYAAGILSFEDAMACAYYRGYSLAMELEGGSKIKGAMIAVGMTEAEALIELEPYKGQVCIGAVNSHSSLTLSGDEPAIIELKESMEKRKIFVRQLHVERAFHSHHIIPYAPILSELVKDIKPQPATCRMFSSVTARLVKADEMGGDYFTANLVGQVRYADALTGTLIDETEEQNVDVLVEIGPHPALKGPSRQTIQALKLEIPYLATLARGARDFEALLICAGELSALGYPVDMEAVNSNLYFEADGAISKPPAGQKRALPSYSWDHGKYWAETRLIKNHRQREHHHSILGIPMPGAVEKHPHWRSFLRLAELPWLSHHMIEGKVIFPAAGYLTMAIEAAIRLDASPKEIKQILLRDVAIKSALTVSDKEMGTEVLLEMQPVSTSAKRTSDTWHRFIINSYSENGRVNEHCYGLIAVEGGPPQAIKSNEPAPSLGELRKRSNRCTPLQKYYNHLHAIGLQYGEEFRLLSGNIESGTGFAMAPLVLRPDATTVTENDRCVVHPTFLDASFHPLFAGVETLLGRPLDEPFVPTFIHSMRVSGAFQSITAAGTEQRLWVCADTKLPGPRVATSNITVRSQNCNEILLDVQGLEATALGSSVAEDQRSLFFRTRWQPAFDWLNDTNQSAYVKNIVQAMDIFAHQYPDSKILHITSDVNSVKEVLQDLGGRQGQRHRFHSITPYSPSSDSSDLPNRWEELQTMWPGLINITEPKAGDFDVVVVSEPNEMDVSAYLKPEGFVISDAVDFDGEGLSVLFRSATISAWRTQPSMTFANGALTLVMSSSPSQETESLASLMTASHNDTVFRASFTELIKYTPASDNIVVLSNLDENLLYDENEDDQIHFEAVQSLFTSSGKNVIWVVRGAFMESPNPKQALVPGMARVVRNENEKIRLTILDVSKKADSYSISQQINKVLESQLVEEEIAEREGTLFIPRLEVDDILNNKLPVNAQGEPKLLRFGDSKQPLALKIGKVGLLETLAFGVDEDIVDHELADDDIEIEVRASAINFRDVAASIGIIDDYRLGDECSGVILRVGRKVEKTAFDIGDRVIAWRPGQGAHRSIVRNPAQLSYKINGSMSFGTAAAFPCILATAYYAFFDLARLQPGEHVLIHAAAGGVGQMAIQVAQMIGANVIATCGSQTKRDLLKSAYGLKDAHIFSSRDPSFVQDVLNLTKGRGVDVVLNSLAGDLLHATWSCIARFGRYVEIGKRDIHENAKIDMEPFRKNVSFASLDLITMFEYNKPLGARMLRESCKLMEDGRIKPPQTIIELSYAEAEKAFRLLQMGKHTGKVVIVPNVDDMVPYMPPVYRNTMIFNPTKTYLLTGGLGGLGRTLAEWMVRKGTRSLAFMSRSGTSRTEAKATVDWLEARDIQVSVFVADVTDYSAVQKCVDSLGDRLAGVFHAAMVLQDAHLTNMTYQQWQRSLGPKIQGADNLHRATLHLDLDFFIPFSSSSAIIGALAQSNYSAANVYLDSLMRHRRELGLKGSTMNLGMITGVGVVAENDALEKTMIAMGSDPVTEEELLYQIEEAVEAGSAPITSANGLDNTQIVTGINLLRKDYYWTSRSLFRNLYANHDIKGASNVKAINSLSVMLQTAADVPERTTILTAAFIEKIAAVLRVAAETIQPSNPLSMYGLDSIVAVELRKWFSKTINVDVALFDILSSKSISALVAKVAALIITDTAAADGDNVSTDIVSANGEASTRGQLSSKVMSDDFTTIVRPSNIPMSTFQRRMWFAHSMIEDKAALNISVTCHMQGKPDVAALKESMNELKRRNEMLRTSYFEGDDFAEQQPIEDFDSRLTFTDLSASPHSLENFIAELKGQVLDIENGEVMRTALIKIEEAHFILVTIIHHIAIDRGSSKSVIEQLITIYDAVRSGKDLSTVPAPQISYIDFAIWYEVHLQSDELQSDVQFWKDNLCGAPLAGKLLPFAKSQRPDHMDTARSVQKMTLGLAMLKRLKRVCTRMGTTPFQFLLAAFRSFLYRYTEEEDLTILAIDGNRPRPDLEDVLGFFVNMIPIRIKQQFEDTGFDHVLTQVKAASIEAIGHSKVPFNAIVDAVKLEKTSSHFPISQVVVNYQMHGKMPRFRTQDFEINKVENDDIPSACEIALEALEDPEHGLDLRLEYSSTLYGEDDMERFFDNFLTFMTSVIQDHRQPITEVEMCGPEELEHLNTNYWNSDFTENTWDDASVVDKILQHAKATPRAVAIQLADGRTLSYKELIDRSERIAASLQELGVRPGESVGVLARPGIDAVTAMVGILIGRCGYLPMDPDFATERLSFMASDSALKVVLISDDLQSVGANIATKIDLSPQIISITAAKGSLGRKQHCGNSPQDPFYTIYTSGSTGNPKGVVLTQSNTQQMLSTMQDDYSFSAVDKFLHQTSIAFDLSIVQIFSALTSGATICIASTGARKDSVALAKYMQEAAVTVTYFTPTQFALLIEHASTALRQCSKYRVAFFAGERLSVRLANAFHNLKIPATMYNTWSPSELVVQTTIHKVANSESNDVSIPIGYPLANCRHYIIDPKMNPLPPSLVGEICVGGAQVGAGYLNRPDANAKSFVKNPFASDQDYAQGWTRLFRTGDRGRFLPDGQLEFHGRIAGDKQVKLRGFRLDLAEIEHRIYLESGKVHDGRLIDVAVVARPVQGATTLMDERQLIAFIVPKYTVLSTEKEEIVSTLHRKIRKHLNDYMLPNGYQFLYELPTTIGGKVNAQNLLARDLQLTFPSSELPVQLGYQATINEKVLEDITQIFKDVLKLPNEGNVAPTDNFFDLGGQSILLLRLQSKLRRTFKKVPSLAELFKAPTPFLVSQWICGRSSTLVQGGNVTDESKIKINWREESNLPFNERFVIPYGAYPISRSDVTEILVTGVDSFIGLHMLANLLSSRAPNVMISVIGSDTRIETADLLKSLQHYKLVGHGVTEKQLLGQVRTIPGTLTEQHFGLSSTAFLSLGRSTQSIYHLGGRMSLLKGYNDIKRLNVGATLDLIELAACGQYKTEIYYLSTWSVAHLQPHLSNAKVDITESPMNQFQPTDNAELVYFKSRWVSEMLLTQAAQRGFGINIFRASTVTGSALTGVPEPEDDFVRRLVLDMIDAGSVFTIDSPNAPPFVLDFVPVNILTAALCDISSSEELREQCKIPALDNLSIYHISNASPLAMADLAALMPRLRADGKAGTQLPLQEWALVMKGKASSEAARLRLAAVINVLEKGHVMFALEASKTRKALEIVGTFEKCPAVDEVFLKRMMGVK